MEADEKQQAKPKLQLNQVDAGAYASQGRQPKASARGARRGGAGGRGGANTQHTGRAWQANRPQTARNQDHQMNDNNRMRGKHHIFSNDASLTHGNSFRPQIAGGHHQNQKKVPAADKTMGMKPQQSQGSFKWPKDKQQQQLPANTRQKPKAPPTQKRFVEQSKNFSAFGRQFKQEQPGSRAQSLGREDDQPDMNEPKLPTHFHQSNSINHFSARLVRIFKAPKIDGRQVSYAEAIEELSTSVLTEDYKQLEEDVFDLLDAVDNKVDQVNVVMTLMKELSAIGEEIHAVKMTMLRESTVEHIMDKNTEQKFQFEEGSLEWLAQQPKLNTCDQALSQLKVAAIDYLIKSSRRECIKDISQNSLTDLLRTLLGQLLAQEKNVYELVSVMFAKACQSRGVDMKPLQPADLVTWRGSTDELVREACLRFIALVYQENAALVPDNTVSSIYECASKIAFLPEKLHRKSSSNFYRTLRAAYNAIANLLAQEEQSSFVRSKNQQIFKLLRREFEYLMSKVRNNHKSRRFVSQTTTVLRALQFSMNLGQQDQHTQKSSLLTQATPSKGAEIDTNKIVNKSTAVNGEILLPDTDAVALFINFYKLLFLGTKFSKRMLKIDVQSTAVHDLGQNIKAMAEASGLTDDESALSDIGSLLFETSDAGARSAAGQDSSDEGWLDMHDEDLDPYQKIKLQANMCMRNLLKNNSKILFNYWYYMFPSFMFRPSSDLAQVMVDMEQNVLEPQKLSSSQHQARRANMMNFSKMAFEFTEAKEPTLFYLIRQSSTQSQLKSSIYATIGQMLDHSHIAKHVVDLEDKDNITTGKENKQGVYQMIDYLGRFLRCMHYFLICSLIEGAQIANMYPTSAQAKVNNYNYTSTEKDEKAGRFFDRQTYIQIIKTIRVLLQMTPYQAMRKGLASIIMQSLIENLQILEKLNNRDQLLRNEIFQALNAVLARSELIAELKVKFMQIEEDKSLSDILLFTLMKVQNFISNEKISILQTLGKNYPEIMTYQWLRIEKGYSMPKIQNFFTQTLQKIERKKVNLILKIIEDWLKNYQVLNHVDSNDEKVLQAEINDISVREAAISAQQKANAANPKGYQVGTILSPYDNDVFCSFLSDVLDLFIFSQPIINNYPNTLPMTFGGMPSANGKGQQRPFKSNMVDEANTGVGGAGHSGPTIGLEINTTISVLNLICIMNHDQFHRVLHSDAQIVKLLDFLSEVLEVSKKLTKVQTPMPKSMSSSPPFVPSILKAAIIKTYGYLIQHQKQEDGGKQAPFTQAAYVTNVMLGHCLSQQILHDSNVNVQIRNSWTLSFICSLYPMEAILQSQSLDVQTAISSSPAPEVQSLPRWTPQTNKVQNSQRSNQQDGSHERLLTVDSSSTIAECNLALLINGLVKYTHHQASNKEKVTASSIRALGFIVQKLITLEHDSQQNSGSKQLLSADAIHKAVRLIVGVIVDKISSVSDRTCTPKVVWNICVAISKIVSCFNSLHRIDKMQDYSAMDYSTSYLQRIFSFETTQSLLSVFMQGQNYKTKIHACQTLMSYANLNQYGFLDAEKNPENLLELFWRHIQEQLKFQINYNRLPTSAGASNYANEQIAYIEQIDRSFIAFWAHVCDLTSIRLICPSTDNQFKEFKDVSAADQSKHHNTMIKYFNENTYDLLQSIIQYLRRELRVPEYSDFFEENEEFTAEDFQNETKQIFEENPLLLPKLQKLQNNVVGKIFDIIACEGSDVHVSFFVFESLQRLVSSDIVQDWRGLEMLRQVRSFNPSQY